MVSGTRATRPIQDLAPVLPEAYAQLRETAAKLEMRYRDMQDIEFTVEDGRLWLLQTRDGKRTAAAAVRIAVDLAERGGDHPRRRGAPGDARAGRLLPAPAADSADAAPAAEDRRTGAGHRTERVPGAAVGTAVFDPDTAQRLAADGRAVILLRPETKPDDVHGMLAAQGIVTTPRRPYQPRRPGGPPVRQARRRRGSRPGDRPGRPPCHRRRPRHRGGRLDVPRRRHRPRLPRPPRHRSSPTSPTPGWRGCCRGPTTFRRLGVRANADNPADAHAGARNGAEGIGLCRTEHMFFAPDRLPADAEDDHERQCRGDGGRRWPRWSRCSGRTSVGLFQAMDGLPVIIRLVDPPLHEFLPTVDELTRRITDAKIRLSSAASLRRRSTICSVGLRSDEDLLEAGCRHSARATRCWDCVECGWRCGTPRSCRCRCGRSSTPSATPSKPAATPQPEIMVPLTTDAGELIEARRADRRRGDRASSLERHMHHPVPGRHHGRDAPRRIDRRTGWPSTPTSSRSAPTT